MPADLMFTVLRRFLVTWRDGEEPPGIHDVGCLSFDGAYCFHYLMPPGLLPAFRPFQAFPTWAARTAQLLTSSRCSPDGSWRVLVQTSRPT